MSHTLTVDGWRLHHNSTVSGLVLIVSPEGPTLTVPFAVLTELVGSALRDGEIAGLEAMTGVEYLKTKAVL